MSPVELEDGHRCRSDAYAAVDRRDVVRAELKVDISELTFVNSSAIRLFIDWAMWIKDANGRGYKLCFTTNRRVTWQKTSLMALRTIAGDALSVEHVD